MSAGTSGWSGGFTLKKESTGVGGTVLRRVRSAARMAVTPRVESPRPELGPVRVCREPPVSPVLVSDRGDGVDGVGVGLAVHPGTPREPSVADGDDAAALQGFTSLWAVLRLRQAQGKLDAALAFRVGHAACLSVRCQ